VLERTLYQRLYKATHLDQVMFSIGLVFMAVAAATFLFGPSQQPVRLPDFLLVVAIGGAGTIKGGLVAAMILGICDVAGKCYVPQIGSFIIYFLMVALMMLFPMGLYGRRA
jgi:branched-subunit amino acid ABC-type transport system permease component